MIPSFSFSNPNSKIRKESTKPSTDFLSFDRKKEIICFSKRNHVKVTKINNKFLSYYNMADGGGMSTLKSLIIVKINVIITIEVGNKQIFKEVRYKFLFILVFMGKFCRCKVRQFFCEL